MDNARGRALLLISALALAPMVSGCSWLQLSPLSEAPLEPPPPPYAIPAGEKLEISIQYDGAVERVEDMVNDDALRSAAAARGLSIVNVMWEDTGRAQGSSLGPNISDLTLQVRRRDPWGRMRDALMPVLRYPNFTDITADVPADRFFLRVGNERGGPLHTEPLAEVLRDLRRFVTTPSSLPSEACDCEQLDLTADRDTHYLVSAQAVFLPIPRMSHRSCRASRPRRAPARS